MTTQQKRPRIVYGNHVDMSSRDIIVCREDDGWWAHYPTGWKSGADSDGCVHADREDTKRQLLAIVKLAMPCTCGDCSAGSTTN